MSTREIVKTIVIATVVGSALLLFGTFMTFVEQSTFAPHPRMTEQPCTYAFDSTDSKPPALTLLWHRNAEGRCQLTDLTQLLAKAKEGR